MNRPDLLVNIKRKKNHKTDKVLQVVPSHDNLMNMNNTNVMPNQSEEFMSMVRLRDELDGMQKQIIELKHEVQNSKLMWSELTKKLDQTQMVLAQIFNNNQYNNTSQVSPPWFSNNFGMNSSNANNNQLNQNNTFQRRFNNDPPDSNGRWDHNM